MKKILLLSALILVTINMMAQTLTFDIATYTTPKGWTKELKGDRVEFSKTNQNDNTWCKIILYKSIQSQADIKKDFDYDWKELVLKAYHVNEQNPQTQTSEADGWKAMNGAGTFTFNGSNAMALLTTISGYGKTISIVTLTNGQAYMPEIEAFLASIDLKKPEINKTDVKNSISNNKQNIAKKDKFAFNTTNFDDGWVSTVQEDWVEVKKGTIRVLIHYPNKNADAYNSVLLDGLKNAWDVLVAPRYSSARNFEFKPITGWESIEFAEADMTEKSTGKTLHVVLFKKNYSNGSGKYLEFISPDKSSFEQEFGVYHQNSYGWEKMENMAYYNKFAVAAADLAGKWTSDFSGAIQYVNANTGLDAGMDTHASNENFIFNSGSTYNWDLAVASGPVGNIKFQSVKSSGTYSMSGNWQVNLSDIEGKPRNYSVYFSCIKGLRILWLDNRPFAKAE